jgi:hypothetical protein
MSASGLGDFPELKLMPEYCVDVPLWPRSLDTDAMVPPVLIQRLIQWQAAFARSFSDICGWTSGAAMEQWANDAILLEQDLRHALPPSVTLIVDLWPLAENAKPLSHE